jgi:ubiquitin carboxyl-terminal hydrolase 34
MIAHVAATSNQIDIFEGKEFLQFFKDVIKLSTNPIGMSQDDIINCCLEHVSLWAPALLNYYESDVREGTETILCEHLLRIGPLEAEDEVKPNVAMVHHLGLACLEFLNEAYVFPRQQAVRATLENILEVIETCSTCIDTDAMVDDPLALRFQQQKQRELHKACSSHSLV